MHIYIYITTSFNARIKYAMEILTHSQQQLLENANKKIHLLYGTNIFPLHSHFGMVEKH